MKKVMTEKRKDDMSLASSEARYRRLFETAQDGILLLNADSGKINDVNPFLIKMLGYSREQFLGKKTMADRRLWGYQGIQKVLCKIANQKICAV